MRLPLLISVAFAIFAGQLEAAPQDLPVELLEKMRMMSRGTNAPVPAKATPSTKPASGKEALRPRLVFGEVVDEKGDPVPGVGVILGSLDSLAAVECLDKPLARTNAKGRFEFTLPPPLVVPTPPAVPKPAPAEIGPRVLALEAKVAEALTKEIGKAIRGEFIDADIAAAKAIEDAKKAVIARKEEIARRKYILLCGDGWIALRVTMPTVNHVAVQKLREAKTDKEKAAKVGLDVLARIWGRAVTPKKDGVDLAKLVVRKGVALSGRVTDEGGKTVLGVRISARDLMTAGRFRGFAAANSKRVFYSYATTGKDGRFRLPGVFASGSQLTIKAKGFFDVQRPVVGAGAIEIRIARSNLIKGKLVQAGGEPAMGSVNVRYEVSSVSHTVKVEKDGSFQFHPKHPHRFRLTIKPSGASAKKHTTTYSPVLDGPIEDFVVTLTKTKAKPKVKKPPKRKPRLSRWARAVKRGFAVSVIDGLTGRPLRDFQAAAIWMRSDYKASESYYMGKFSSNVKKSKQPGYVRVPGPKTSGTPKGVVIVKAKGYAPFVQMGIEFDPAAPPRVIAAMVPESILGGDVFDVVSGEVVVAVTVRLYPVTKSGGNGRAVNARTDPRGRFVFKGLRKGRYRVTVNHKGRPAKAITLELTEAEKRRDLRLVVGRATRLTGRIVGIKPGKDWKVELLNEGNAMSMLYNPGYRPSGVRAKLKDDGSFEFKGISPGFYEVCLHIPRDGREGAVLQIPLEPIRIRKGRDAHVIVDASEDLPAQLTGKIELTGSKLDFARLMVVVMTHVPTSPWAYNGYNNIDVSGARSRVGSDGTFSVRVVSGKKRIKIIDVITGVQFYQSEVPIEVESGQTKTRDVKLALTEVTVKLKPAKEGGRISATWLNIDVEQPKPEALQMFVFFSSYNGKRATGVSLQDYAGEIKLVLPPYKTKFQVYSDVARLSRAKRRPRSTLGEAEFTPKLGEANKVEIEVEVPTTGFEIEPVDKKKIDDDLGDGEGPARKKKPAEEPAKKPAKVKAALKAVKKVEAKK
jgi:hypothetical protein